VLLMVSYEILGVRVSEGELDTIHKLILVYWCIKREWPDGPMLKKWLKNLGKIVV